MVSLHPPPPPPLLIYPFFPSSSSIASYAVIEVKHAPVRLSFAVLLDVLVLLK